MLEKCVRWATMGNDGQRWAYFDGLSLVKEAFWHRDTRLSLRCYSCLNDV